MGALSITGIKPGSTSLKLTAGTITKTVPITVLSRNLLSYGPAEGNGLTATVNTDGSLHVTGTATGQWRGLSWTFPCPVQGTVKLKGSTTQKVDSWDSLTCSVHVDAGTYTLDASDWPYDSISWLIGIQSTLTPDDGSGQTIAFEPKGYGPRPLKAGTLRLNIFVNTTGEVDKTFTPRLYKID